MFAIGETGARTLPRMRPPSDQSGFMYPSHPSGWVQFGQSWGLWWHSRQIASVQPDTQGIRVVLSCRKLWQDKTVRAASVAQGKRYAERWCAARVLPDLPLREAVAQLVAKDVAPAQPRPTRTQLQQQRRLNAIPNPKLP